MHNDYNIRFTSGYAANTYLSMCMRRIKKMQAVFFIIFTSF